MHGWKIVDWTGFQRDISCGNGLGRVQCGAVGTGFSGQMSSYRLSWKIVDARLVKRSQDRSNGFQRLKNGTCTAKRLLLQGFRFAWNRGKKSWEEVNAELLAQVFRDKFQQQDCPETLCAQDWSNGVQMLGNGTCTGKNLLIGRGFNQTSAVEMAWGELNAELLVRVLQDKCHRCDCLKKLWTQDWSNGPKTGQMVSIGRKKWDMQGKTFVAAGVSLCIQPWKKSWEEVNAELLAQGFRDKFQQCDCPETLCAQDWSNGVQMLGNGTCTGNNLLIGRGFNQTWSCGNGLGRVQCRAVGAGFSGQISSLRLSWKIVYPRLVKRSQDWSNGFQTLKNGTWTAKRLLLQAVSFSQESFYTQKLLHRSFDTEKPLHRGAFTYRRVSTKKRLHTEAFTQSSFYTKKAFYTNKPVHREACTHRSFYTEQSFRQRNLYTEELSHREVFTQRRFYTQKLLHKETFTHRSFYTQKLLDKKLLHKQTCTHRSFYTQKLLHREVF